VTQVENSKPQQHIVLVCPEIPQNTGTIGRLCVSTNTRLHLIKPLGFDLSEKALRRAGLDYWKYLDHRVYQDLDEFRNSVGDSGAFVFFSTKSDRDYWDIEYTAEPYLFFGKETAGLAPSILNEYSSQLARIPMFGSHSRSLNLAVSAGIAVYDVIRKRRSS